MTKEQLIKGIGQIKNVCQAHYVYDISIDDERVSIYDVLLECMKLVAASKDEVLYIPRDEFVRHCEIHKYYWIELKYTGIYFLELLHNDPSGEDGSIFTFDTPFHKPNFITGNYNKTWRVWDHEPTVEERVAEEWNA